MTVQCVKGGMLSAFMFQQDDRSIILGRGIICKGKYHSAQWSIHGRIHWNEQIHSKVNSAIFVGRLIASRKGGCDVKITRFIVTSDANGCTGFADSLQNARRQMGFIILSRVTAEEW